VVVFRRFNLPPVLGYLFVGSVIGPHALNLMDDMNRPNTWPNSAWFS
jgi:CPA2 family monovalent cation:H+ antiporter-2